MLKKLKTEQLFNILPENLYILKDGGLWGIYEDSANDITMNDLYHQKLNENLREFLIRVISEIRKEEFNASLEIDLCISVSDDSYGL